MDGCSQALKGLLEPNQSFFYAVDEIRKASHLHPEARTVLAGLAQANVPATSVEIVGELAPLIALYGVPDKSEDEWAAFWRIYVEDLGRYPVWAIASATRAYRRQKDANWFPRPGPLKALCDEAFAASCAAQSRLTRALTPPPSQAEAR